MNRKLFPVMIGVFMCCNGISQNSTPVSFDKISTWKEVLQKAKRENKFIFIDAWTTWCSPCIYMNKKVFPVTGEYFNKQFINIKLQLDTTAKDDKATKAAYALATSIRKQYGIETFPTFLFFDPSGKIVHRAMGGIDSTGLLDLGRRALDPSKQYYTLKEKFDQGNYDSQTLLALFDAANQAGEETIAFSAANTFLAQQTDLYSDASLRLLRRMAYGRAKEVIPFFLYNQEKIDQKLGAGKSLELAAQPLINGSLSSFLFNQDFTPRTTVNWDQVNNELRKVLPAMDRDKIVTLIGWIRNNYSKGGH